MKQPKKINLPKGTYLKRDWIGMIKSAWRRLCGNGSNARISFMKALGRRPSYYNATEVSSRIIVDKAFIDKCVEWLKSINNFDEKKGNILLLPEYHPCVSYVLYQYAQKKGIRIVHDSTQYRLVLLHGKSTKN